MAQSSNSQQSWLMIAVGQSPTVIIVTATRDHRRGSATRRILSHLRQQGRRALIASRCCPGKASGCVSFLIRTACRIMVIVMISGRSTGTISRRRFFCMRCSWQKQEFIASHTVSSPCSEGIGHHDEGKCQQGWSSVDSQGRGIAGLGF